MNGAAKMVLVGGRPAQPGGYNTEGFDLSILQSKAGL